MTRSEDTCLVGSRCCSRMQTVEAPWLAGRHSYGCSPRCSHGWCRCSSAGVAVIAFVRAVHLVVVRDDVLRSIVVDVHLPMLLCGTGPKEKGAYSVWLPYNSLSKKDAAAWGATCGICRLATTGFGAEVFLGPFWNFVMFWMPLGRV